MNRWAKNVFLLMLAAGLCASLHAQTARTINLRILDAKTGRPVTVNGFMVRVDHQKTVHADWVKQEEDGTAVLTLPADVTDVSIRTTYDDATEVFFNCDVDARKGEVGDRWYKVAEILSTGVVAPNSCVKPAVVQKLKTAIVPGQFVQFVRARTWHESSQY
jgi:hypothetical protein